MTKLQPQSPAPGFTLAAAGGSTVDLASLKGSLVVVYFYPKDDTSGCTSEAVAFSGLKDAFADAGCRIVGISPDSVASHDAFIRKHDLSITLAADPDHAVAEAYGVWGEKSMYGRKFMGIERSTFLIGRDGRILRVWAKVKVPGHAEQVLAAAQEASAAG